MSPAQPMRGKLAAVVSAPFLLPQGSVWRLKGLSGHFRGVPERAFRGVFEVLLRPVAVPWRETVLPCANFPVENPRKTRGFRASEKTLKKYQKTACIENPVLISYSPVAPLKATPNGARRLIFEKRKLEVKENCNVNEIARFLAKRIRAYDGCLGIMRR